MKDVVLEFLALFVFISIGAWLGSELSHLPKRGPFDCGPGYAVHGCIPGYVSITEIP
jgi:hypothetical protein